MVSTSTFTAVYPWPIDYVSTVVEKGVQYAGVIIIWIF